MGNSRIVFWQQSVPRICRLHLPFTFSYVTHPRNDNSDLPSWNSRSAVVNQFPRDTTVQICLAVSMKYSPDDPPYPKPSLSSHLKNATIQFTSTWPMWSSLVNYRLLYHLQRNYTLRSLTTPTSPNAQINNQRRVFKTRHHSLTHVFKCKLVHLTRYVSYRIHRYTAIQEAGVKCLPVHSAIKVTRFIKFDPERQNTSPVQRHKFSGSYWHLGGSNHQPLC